MRPNFRKPTLPAVFAALLAAGSALGQVTPAKGYDPVDDTPTVKVGGVIFADYTYQDKPRVTDSNHDTIHQNSFNLSRAYLNVFANISHLLSARITSDVKTDTNTADTSLNGSTVIRLKYAYGQLNLDEWTGKGSFLRIGMQTTPWIDYSEGIYRYRFQGPIFVDREGILASSDFGFSGHYNLPSNYGDVHLGVYNGEGYTSQADQTGANDQKAVQFRASIRPAPTVAVLNGLRITGFIDGDDYVRHGAKQRILGQVSFENPHINASVEYLRAEDRKTPGVPLVKSEGWSAWATPRTSFGLEALLRYDALKPNRDVDAWKKRTIAGIAYWFPVQKGVSSALLADYEQVKYDSPLGKPKEQRWALHTLFSF